MARVIVTGGAGFIGSNLVDRLVGRYEVTVLDNLSSGKKEYVNPKAVFIRKDLLDRDIKDYFDGASAVYHLAANPDVRLGAYDTRVHLEQNVLATYNVLEAMREKNVPELIFTSTSTVYGAASVPTPESFGPLRPVSLYGASKLACEAFISSYCFTFGLRARIYRFANVVGKRSTHGVIYDFVRKLRQDPHSLEILGDGKQRKSYVYIDDCVAAMLSKTEPEEAGPGIYNIGTAQQTAVTRIAEIVSEEMGLTPRFNFTGGAVGWKGDVPVMLLSIEKIKATGWEPRYDSDASVRKAVKDVLEAVAV